MARGMAFNIQRQTIDGYESALLDVRKTSLLEKGSEGSEVDSP
jgi:hypothetical protein